jgi:hypothetical protein
VLGRWGSFLILKGKHLGFCKKRFATTLAHIIGNVEKIGGELKMVYSAYQFAKTWF